MMDETIKQQVYAVLDKYDKNYSNSGIDENVQSWQGKKGWLVELLRRHPNWNEEELAVVFNVIHSREINEATVDMHSCELSKLITDLNVTEEDQMKFNRSINATVFTYSKILPSADTVTLVKELCGVTCVVGQKTSRIINAICKKYGLDKHPEYDARFAKLADSLNPMQVKRTALLSVHPCDFLEMSNQNNSWYSCHCLDDGTYHAGTLSYMNDECSMIFYTVDDDVTEKYHTEPKRTRQIFCYNNGILLQSRLYPQTDDDESRDMYRNIVQRTIADCLMVPNLWELKRNQEDIDQHVRTHGNALHYCDYLFDTYKANISLLKNATVEQNEHILVGHTAYCLDCAEPISEHSILYCDSCYDDDFVTCYDCNRTIREDDAHYVEGDWYCSSCCSNCEHCYEDTISDMTEVHDRDNRLISVCQSCRDNHYHYCENCDEYFHEYWGRFFDEDNYEEFCCDDCFDQHYSTCENCGDYVCKENTGKIDDKYYCESCAEDILPEADESVDNTAA